MLFRSRRAGLVDFGNENVFEGWNEDPYNPDYKKGALMNLSERAGLDGVFPYHPLSQCRELIKSLISDKLVIIKKEDESKKEEKKEGVNEKEFMLKIFNNEVDRHTYDVEIL